MEKQRKTVAVICEYNPFHYGHRYQIGRLKENYHCVVGIMSGAFVQRGDVAVEDKYRRAAAALCGGMDLVVELPFPYSVSSGGDFAAAGVRIAAALGVDALAFGCEDPEAPLFSVAQLIQSTDFEAETAALIKEQPSLSYPRARTALIEKHLGAEAAGVLNKPNNILAVEYMACCIKEGLTIELCPVKRNQEYKSATEIRAAANMDAHIPFPEFFGEPRSLKYRERELISLLRHGNYEGLYCIDQSLAATLKSAAKESASLEELVAAATGKTYTAARVRRAMITAWLEISTAAVKSAPAFTCLLGANSTGLEFLKVQKGKIALPLITKPADYTKLEESARNAFEAALAAEEQAALCAKHIKPYTSPLCATPYIKK